ncbi:MAG: hypothetical protein ACJ8AT_27740 [Hyalangium sp.]|uniref:hypothetical protein n=1 Tax=Hyalangium sp. TaxID=2028555 RepID=UPI00389ADFB6
MQSTNVLDQHRKVLGILYLVFGGLWAIAGIALLAVVLAVALPEVRTGQERAVILLVGGAGGLLLLGMAAVGVMGGTGMLRRRAWAKVPTLIVGMLGLLHVPIGTAVGVYTLWFWLQPNAPRLFFPQAFEPQGPELGGPGFRRPVAT